MQLDSTLPPPLDEDPYWVAVPLWRKKSVVVGWVYVSLIDLSIVGAYRWVPIAKIYAGRYEKVGDRWTAIYLHREILGLPRESDGLYGDHKNHNKQDSRRDNLRIVPPVGSDESV